jgi:alpha/beta superfamily hydrolase
MRHVKFSTFRSKPQVEFHDSPDCNPALANKFNRFTFGSTKAAKIARAILANGPAKVLAAIAQVAAAALTPEERTKLLTLVQPDADVVVEFAQARPASDGE